MFGIPSLFSQCFLPLPTSVLTYIRKMNCSILIQVPYRTVQSPFTQEYKYLLLSGILGFAYSHKFFYDTPCACMSRNVHTF